MNIHLVIFILVSLLASTLVCIAASRRYGSWLIQITFAAIVASSMVTASKLVTLTDGAVVSVAIGLYSATFLLTDFLSERYSKKEAMRAVWMGVVAEIVILVAVAFSIWVPAASFWTGQAAFEEALGSTVRVVIASIAAFVSAQILDVLVYNKILAKTGRKKMWLRSNVSTILAQATDTVVFYSIAFAGIVPDLFRLIWVTWLIKIGISLLETPFLYIARHFSPTPLPGSRSNSQEVN
jgi:queuosine precursor transporter